MSLEIVEIKERGNHNKERIVLKAASNIDIGYFIVFLTIQSKDSFETNPKKVYWFPDKLIKKNDVVVLYSKKGTNTFKVNPSGNSSHFFYWGNDISLFLEKNKIAVLIEAKRWTYEE